MHSWAQLTAASRATTAATAAANSRPPRVRRRRPARLRPGRAASQAAAAACSAAVSIRAHRCLTAWNWPIGRPNWCRIFAYSAAVRTAQSAMPHASAANSVGGQAGDLARVRPGRTRPAGTGTPLARTLATGLVRSRLSSAVTTRSRRPPPPSAPCRRRSAPAGSAGRPGSAEDRPRLAVEDQRRRRCACRSARRPAPPPRSATRPPARPASLAVSASPPATPPRRQHRAGQHGGQEPARDQGAAQFLQRHRQLAEAVALAAVLLRQVQAEQARAARRPQHPRVAVRRTRGRRAAQPSRVPTWPAPDGLR